jgi:nucleotide-binding universal stress UspA family protein
VAAAVLAAYDPVASDRAPVRFGAFVAGHTGAPLLVAAVSASEDEVDPLAAGQLGEDLSGDAGDALGEAVREAGAAATAGADSLQLWAASAPRALSLAAEELGAGLLVVGSAARAPEGRVLPGATGDRLLHGGPCPVALVPAGWQPPDPPGTFAAAFVESAEGRAAVHGGQALARRAGVRLRVLAAVQPREWTRTDVADLRTRAENSAEEAAATVLGVAVDVDVEVREPAEYLLAVSEEVDLLVCGARGYGPGSATLLGGVTRRVTAEAACPVIVLSRGGREGLEALIAETA